MNKLEEICATKHDEVRERQSATQVSELIARIAAQALPRGFEAALRQTHAGGRRALIAEIKKASPSKGLIREDFQPAEHAKAYAAAGASCLSVLTDAPYFQGHSDYLVAAREACALPALRKDFMVDPWQCGEARAMGADAILIIVAALTDQQAAEIERDLEGATVERVGEGIKITFDSGILFAVDKSDLQPAAQQNLAELAVILNKYADTEILIEGHTDASGSADYNMTLSRNRADSVARYLEVQHVMPTRFTLMAYGEEQPIADNTTVDGRAANRRVELAIFANDKLKKEAERKAG